MNAIHFFHFIIAKNIAEDWDFFVIMLIKCYFKPIYNVVAIQLVAKQHVCMYCIKNVMSLLFQVAT